jgi:hypothetical protein
VRVWDLESRGWPWSATWREFPKAQINILAAFLNEAPSCFLHINPTDLKEWSTSNIWEQVATDTFRLPQGLSAEELTSEALYVGGYHLYCGPQPIPPGLLQIDPWRTAPSALTRMVQDQYASALLFAYHDNDSWRIIFS